MADGMASVDSGRRFCRFRTDGAPGEFSALPEDGMCLSAFVLLHPEGSPEPVLLGRVAPDPAWSGAGALTPDRVERLRAGWMLPSSHLLLFEGPEAAARRILREQLGLEGIPLSDPRVASEAYARDGRDGDPHWDLHFLFEGTWPAGRPPRHPLWTDLRFLEIPRIRRGEIARGHADILALAGRPPAA